MHVREGDPALGIGHPDQRWRGIRHVAEPGLALPQSGLAAHPLGDVGTLHEQAADPSLAVHDGLIDEVDEALLECAAWHTLSVEPHRLASVVLPRFINAVEQFEKPLS